MKIFRKKNKKTVLNNEQQRLFIQWIYRTDFKDQTKIVKIGERYFKVKELG